MRGTSDFSEEVVLTLDFILRGGRSLLFRFNQTSILGPAGVGTLSLGSGRFVD